MESADYWVLLDILLFSCEEEESGDLHRIEQGGRVGCVGGVELGGWSWVGESSMHTAPVPVVIPAEPMFGVLVCPRGG
jgi:hypothetical protein